MPTPIPAGWKPVPIEPTDAMLDAGCEKHVCTQGDPWYSSPDLSEGDCKAIYAAMLAAAPSPASPPNDARDWELTCDHCDGDGFVYVERRVGPCQTDIQTFKEECECCEGRGFTIVFEDIPGIEEYVRKSRPTSVAPGDAQAVAWMNPETQDVITNERKVSWLTTYGVGMAAKAAGYSQPLGVLAAPAAGDARDLPLAQKYEDACILANANAQDAARYRSHRAALTSVNTAWLDNVTAALEAMGLDPDDADALPTAAQVDAAFDAALAAQVPQQGEA